MSYLSHPEESAETSSQTPNPSALQPPPNPTVPQQPPKSTVTGPTKIPVNANTTTSSTASHQHQQEQEMLSNFAIPNPPISTQQSSVAAEKENSGSENSGDVYPPRTLWMGDLDPWLSENGIADLWWKILQKKVTVKIIKPKTSKPDTTYQGLSHSGYCFVEFETFEDAQLALGLNGQLLPDIAMPSQQHFPNNPDNQKKYFRLNWASGATLSAPIVQTPEYSLFVGDLSASTTEAHLLAFFQKNFPTSIKTVRVMTDPVSGKSRCFGFVRFTDESERQRALVEMNGVWFGGRPLRVALATPRNNNRGKFQNQNQNQNSNIQSNYYGNDPQQELMYMQPPPQMRVESPYGYYGGPQMPPPGGPYDLQNELDVMNMEAGGVPLGMKSPLQPQNVQPQPFTDPNNTTVFVGGLSSEVTEPTLFTLFKPFGIIQQVKIPPGKNCGFIKYSTREEAEEAIAAMQGFIIGGNRVRLSWGRVSMNNKKFQQQQQQVAHAAQLQAAAALSMGMDPAGAIAAAAAVAAGGYPPPPMPGAPQIGGLPPPLGIHPPPIPPGASNFQTPLGGQGGPQESDFEKSHSRDRSTSYDDSPGSNTNISPQFYMPIPPPGAEYNMPPQGPPPSQEALIKAMGGMSLQGGDGGDPGDGSELYLNAPYMAAPPRFGGGYPIHPEMQFQRFIQSPQQQYPPPPQQLSVEDHEDDEGESREV
ncbi:negative growth regulatory protein [Scheffersomyces xylosifermentans]|uniref:negative growth regulatory protein n=1 Tax=Scheffersomyces xylosifermentans TaxID=1304137 RepID=UPI00315C5C4E